MTTQYRQGDVLLLGVESLPMKARQLQVKDRIVLAEGEATGHAHAVTASGTALYQDDLGRRFLEVLLEGGVGLTHEEHATIMLPPGFYEIRRQREYTPEATRPVED